MPGLAEVLLVAEGHDERGRSVRIIEAFAEAYEKTARNTASDDVAFVAKEIADALRRCAAAIQSEGKTTPDATGSLNKAFVETRPTKVDLSDKIVDV